jgi:hypothetical protein
MKSLTRAAGMALPLALVLTVASFGGGNTNCTEP